MQLWLKFVLPGLNMFFLFVFIHIWRKKNKIEGKKTDSKKKKILVKLVVVIEAASFLFYTCLLLF